MNKEFDIGKVFDELIPDYTGFMERAVPYYRELISQLVELPSDFKPNEILDLGCGNGNSTEILSQLFPEASFTLLDASEEMIKCCKNRFANSIQIKLVQGYFQDIQFKEDSFDLIVAGLSLHHLTSPLKKEVFASIYNWLKKKGIFSYSDLMINRASVNHQLHMQKWRQYAREKGASEEEWNYIVEHYEKYDFPDHWEDQIVWLNKAGFQKIKIPWRKGNWCRIKGEK